MACTCRRHTLQLLLTLFPECFSPFDRSTCALSVSQSYSAFAKKHLPNGSSCNPKKLYSSSGRALFCSSVRWYCGWIRDSHPLWNVAIPCAYQQTSKIDALLQANSPARFLQHLSKISNRVACLTSLPDGSIRQSSVSLHSPLLRQSLLFSFPPPTNMLKLGGSPHRSSGLDKNGQTQTEKRIHPTNVFLFFQRCEIPKAAAHAWRGGPAGRPNQPNLAHDKHRRLAIIGAPHEKPTRQDKHPPFCKSTQGLPRKQAGFARKAAVHNRPSNCRQQSLQSPVHPERCELFCTHALVHFKRQSTIIRWAGWDKTKDSETGETWDC